MIDVRETVKLVEEGHLNPLQSLAELKLLAKEISEGISAIEDHAFREAENYGEKTFKDFGYEFQVKEGMRRYDFSKIEEWTNLKDQIKQKESLYKMAASSYDKGTRVFDEQTGEQIPIPLVKYSKGSISIKKLPENNA